MLFITSVYGKNYSPYLSVLLNSLQKTHPKDKVLVFWKDLEKVDIKILSNYFKNVTFKKVSGKINYQNIHVAIPQKLDYWQKACAQTKEKYICFLDCDTLVYKNIDKFLKGNFDFIYTWKDEKYPLNTGVVIVKNSPKIARFIKIWRDKTKIISDDPEKLTEACDRFGAADQKALYDLLATNRFNQAKKVKLPFGEILTKGVPCAFLNQINSVPVHSGSHIFHYKGAWRNMLLNGTGYSKKRSKDASIELKDLWEKYLSEVTRESLKKYALDVSTKHKNILRWQRIPLQSRGILHSEMLLAISTMKDLDIDLVIESGRANGQSTEILAKALPEKNIISIELLRDRVSRKAEKRLNKYKNLKLVYGDTNKVLWEILEKHKSEKVALLFDGPKGKEAYDLFMRGKLIYDNVSVGYFHDCRKPAKDMPNPSREIAETYFERIFFSDDLDYVKSFKCLDKNVISKNIDEHSWRPYKKGDKTIGSYGPTIAVVFPTYRDLFHFKTKFRNGSVIRSAISKILNLIR